ncbi:MAG: relaxase/mobilization nuclease domain-containing protein [Clostridia bacterium]|nr:relaxase/mobilization nuclease domain-containing protein [Clostridia bacterium]
MATVKIWKVKYRLDHVIDYAANIEKTSLKDKEDLKNVLDYAVNPSKTEQKLFVDAINCYPASAYEQMQDTKEEHKKTNGILAFHAYQSFAPGEVTPEVAHKIGVEFAKRMWGDRFEVVIGTHLDTGCCHNHFVLNSVSFVDGKKYYDNLKNYARMRELSDNLCREYGLSVIENPGPSKHISRYEYMEEKAGKVTKNVIFRKDIDECILLSENENDFFREMKKRGYIFDFSHKYVTLSHPLFPKARRLRNLGQEYEPDRLAERIEENIRRKKVDLPEQDNTVEDYFEDLDNENYQQVYVRFVTVVKIVKTRPERNRELQKRFFQEVRKLDRLIEQQNLLCDNDIESYEQLEQFSSSRKDELTELTKARDILRNKLKVAIRSGDEKEENEIREHISNLSVMIKKLRRDIVICDRIEKQKPVIDERIEQAKESNSRKELMNYERIR